MPKQLRRLAFVSFLVSLFVIGIGLSAQVSAQESATAYITSPSDGETISGLVTVTGAADMEDFLKYEVYLKSGETMAWVATVYAPVINGNLARLDTRIYLDGTYQLVLRLVKSDSNFTEVVGPTVTIANGLGAPLPHPEIESSFLYPVDGLALVRVKNCSGRNMEFDYVSPDGFCSSDNLWIMPKEQESNVCTSVDLLLIPCEYRGTAMEEGSTRGVTYMFDAEPGKIYMIDFPGGDKLFLGEIPGDERASTDTGGLDRGDPNRAQPAPVMSNVKDKSAPATDKGGQEDASTDEGSGEETSPGTLPESGRGQVSNTLFVGVAGSLIALLLVGGIVAATRRQGYSA